MSPTKNAQLGASSYEKSARESGHEFHSESTVGRPFQAVVSDYASDTDGLERPSYTISIQVPGRKCSTRRVKLQLHWHRRQPTMVIPPP